MAHHYVFVADRPEPLYDCEDCTVLETYHFGAAGAAAKIDCEDETAVGALDAVDEMVDDSVEFSIRTTANVQDTATATIEEIRTLHQIPTVANDTTTGRGVRWVVMDSGVDTGHPLFGDDTIKQVDVTGEGTGDDVGHGTAVTGQIKRIAPNTTLQSLRIFGTQGSTSFDVILRAYEWLFQHASEIDGVNMSWGTSRRVKRLDDLQNRLAEQGVLCVVAAGNSGGTGGSPATATASFSAGACTTAGDLAPFSDYNPEHDNPDVTSVGVNCRLAQARGTTMGSDLSGPWVQASGTSFSAPILSAVTARFIERYGSGVESAFEKHADDLESTPRDGGGILKFAPAMGAPPERPDETTIAEVWSIWVDGRDLIYLEENWLADDKYRVSKTERDGRTILTFEAR